MPKKLTTHGVRQSENSGGITVRVIARALELVTSVRDSATRLIHDELLALLDLNDIDISLGR